MVPEILAEGYDGRGFVGGAVESCKVKMDGAHGQKMSNL